MNQPLVSIIIPTYNRANLILETLQSVQKQTYTNWECIIVDDGSTDNTQQVVSNFIKQDTRFQYHIRPEHHKPGGNGARNYGFTLSRGDYINWFDSDDIMLNNNLDVKMSCFSENEKLAYVISKFSNFISITNPIEEEAFKKNNANELSLLNYIKGDFFWGTIDFLGHKSLLTNFKYNEELKSGQEYNFFISVLSNNRNFYGKFINKNLALRRVHKNSIQQIQKINPNLRISNKFKCYYLTFLENRDSLTKDEKQFLLEKILVFYHKRIINKSIKSFQEINNLLLSLKIELNIFTFFSMKLLYYVTFVIKKGDVFGSLFIKRLFDKNYENRR